jgi:translation elongation factor EF-1alpha
MVYQGPTLVEAIDQFVPPVRQINKAFRIEIHDFGPNDLWKRAATAGESFLLMPVGLALTIKGMEHGKQIKYARAGDTVDLGVSGNPFALSIGSLLCSIAR